MALPSDMPPHHPGLMDPLDELISWATAKGVKMNGIRPERMPGRGVGIVATQQITVSFFNTATCSTTPDHQYRGYLLHT